MQWLTTQEGFELDRELFVFVCECGNLEIMKWLRSEGCPWGASACRGAASNGHLDVLKWAVDKGCPYEVNKYTRPALESLGLA